MLGRRQRPAACGMVKHLLDHRNARQELVFQQHAHPFQLLCQHGSATPPHTTSLARTVGGGHRRAHGCAVSGRRRCRSKPTPSHLAAQAAAAACGPHGRECASADALLKAVPPPCGSARDGQLRCGACGDRCPGPQCQRTHRPMMACTTLLPSSRSTHIVRTTPVCAAIAHAAAAAYRSAYRRGAT